MKWPETAKQFYRFNYLQQQWKVAHPWRRVDAANGAIVKEYRRCSQAQQQADSHDLRVPGFAFKFSQSARPNDGEIHTPLHVRHVAAAAVDDPKPIQG